MDEKQAEEWAAYLQSKELRRDLRPLVWMAAAWMAAGPGAGAAMWWGWKLCDKFSASLARREAAANDPGR